MLAMLAPLLALAPPRASADTVPPETLEEILQDPVKTSTMVIILSLGVSMVVDVCEEHADTIENMATAAAAWRERNDPVTELALRTFTGVMASISPNLEAGDKEDMLDHFLPRAEREQALKTMEQEADLDPSTFCATAPEDLASGSMDITGAPDTMMPELFGPAIANMRGWLHRWQNE